MEKIPARFALSESGGENFEKVGCLKNQAQE
jgi:hypothetical protein